MWICELEDEARDAQPRAVVRDSFEASNLEVRMFNVGEGEAILVIFPDRRTWLIDGGTTNNLQPNETLGELLVGYLEGHALTLEACVASHPHVDHAGALATLLSSGSQALAPTVTVYRGAAAWTGKAKWLDGYHPAITALGGAGNQGVLSDAHRE